MTDLNGMAIFAKVVEAKGYSQASRNTGLPKSTISRKISQLEDLLGVRLLQRNTRGLSLTHVGALYYQHCANIVKEIEQATATIENSHQDVSGLLRIALPVSFNQDAMATLCSGFLRKFPKIDIDIQFIDSEVSLIGEGYDIAIKYGPLEPSDLIARVLIERQPILVASDTYLNVHGAPMTPQDLSLHQGLLLGTPRSSAIWPLGLGTEKTMVQFERRVRVNSNTMLKQMTKAGVGIAMLTESICREELSSGMLKRVLQEFPIEPIKVYGVYSSRRQLATKITSFLDFFAEHFANHETLAPLMANQR
ncbi:LysR family transcriptional regulator [Motilimonas pumila]|uniref:LysR family transcriptional regulator n=1 Tax=Motilimonas pumila TaxID=2303987 RepID=A0A418YJ39_9GAMM|nr:LysR family transcriptional regulator [Motilimonas pumila]RJG50650.1 LysR family transcriptional regulator [Motilimonas pumila]